MPKLTHHLPGYRKHKASGQAVVSMAGKDIYLGPYGSKASKTEYERLIGELVANHRQPPVSQPEDDLTVSELMKLYWTYAKGYYRKNGQPTRSLDSVKASLRYLRRHYGRTPATEFGPLRLKAVRERMIAADLSRSYINASIGRIKQMFRWAVSEELLPVTVHQAIATVPGLKKGRSEARETDPVAPVSDEVVSATVEYLPTVVADIVRFQVLTGARPGEVCLLRPCDVDTTGDVWEYRPESHKTEHHGRERAVFIGPKAQDVLRPYLLRDKAAYCFVPAESERKRNVQRHENRQTPMTPSQTQRRRKRNPVRSPGNSYTKNSYRRAIHRAVDKANKNREDGKKLPYWHPNQLRHAAATSIRKQYGLEAAQVTLGHAKADVTQIYAERDFDLAKQIMREVG